MSPESQRLAIAVLCVLAGVLVVALVLSTAGPQGSAMALGTHDRGGDYIVVTGQYTENKELVFVADAAAMRLNVYSFEPTRNIIVLWDQHDLRREFGR